MGLHLNKGFVYTPIQYKHVWRSSNEFALGISEERGALPLVVGVYAQTTNNFLQNRYAPSYFNILNNFKKWITLKKQLTY